MGVLAAIKQSTDATRPAFVSDGIKLDVTSVADCFNILWSEVGSNRYSKETKVIGYFMNWLQEMEGV